MILGDQAILMSMHDARLFWTRTVPQITVVISVLMAVFVLSIWAQRREEALFGLLGLGLLLWGIRTLTFVIEDMPADQWLLWRCIYHASTGGFIIVMGMFALRFAKLSARWLDVLLLLYWSVGPIAMLLGGIGMERVVARVWSAGLIPVGVLIVVMECLALVRQRSWQALALIGTSAIALLAGVHDYLLASGSAVLGRLLPEWVGHRYFLLHHAANLLLLTTAGIMTARFVETLTALQILNKTLESRVKAREQQLSESFVQRARLAREMAAEEERQRIMLDMHDGLGSRLFTSLSRVERGDMPQRDVAAMLRDCINEMRLVLDAMAPASDGVRCALGSFRYRWERQLAFADVASSWLIASELDEVFISAHQRLQILHVMQEGLTNVLKHAQATTVKVEVGVDGPCLCVLIQDNGKGLPEEGERGGRGLGNIRLRARRMGAEVSIQGGAGGTRIYLSLPVQAIPH